MDTETGLSLLEQQPKEVIARASIAATQLKAVVDQRGKVLKFQGKEYLYFEDWQTLGRFFGVTARVTSTEEIREDGRLVGFLASAEALCNGEVISAADAECTYDEKNWQAKPRFQLRSMSQTRACAKCLRNCLAWVAVLAGYEGTPADEMVGAIGENGEKATTQRAQPRGKADWKWFWAKVRGELGLDNAGVCSLLGINSVKEDLISRQHKTLEEVYDMLKRAVAEQEPAAPKTEPPAGGEDDLFPEDDEPPAQPPAERSEQTITNMGQMLQASREDFGYSKDTVLLILGMKRIEDVVLLPWEAYGQVKKHTAQTVAARAGVSQGA